MRNISAPSRSNSIQSAYDGLLLSDFRAKIIKDDTLYYAVHEDYPRRRIHIPDEIDIPASCSEPKFLDALRSIPFAWKLPCKCIRGCNNILLVIMMIDVNSCGMILRTWKTYCPFCCNERNRYNPTISRYSIL